jgi:hypothetical protein
MPFGGQTISLTAFTQDGVADELGIEGVEEDSNDAYGCRHRPLTFAEAVELGYDIATQPWRSTIPIGEYDSVLQGKLLALKPQDVIYVDGQKYQIQGGVRCHPDMAGNPFKVTIISKKQIS